MVFGKHYEGIFSDWYVFYSNDNKGCQDGRIVQHKKKYEKLVTIISKTTKYFVVFWVNNTSGESTTKNKIICRKLSIERISWTYVAA